MHVAARAVVAGLFLMCQPIQLLAQIPADCVVAACDARFEGAERLKTTGAAPGPLLAAGLRAIRDGERDATAVAPNAQGSGPIYVSRERYLLIFGLLGAGVGAGLGGFANSNCAWIGGYDYNNCTLRGAAAGAAIGTGVGLAYAGLMILAHPQLKPGTIVRPRTPRSHTRFRPSPTAVTAFELERMPQARCISFGGYRTHYSQLILSFRNQCSQNRRVGVCAIYNDRKTNRLSTIVPAQGSDEIFVSREGLVRWPWKEGDGDPCP